MSLGLFHIASSASLYQDFNCCSQSGCLVQKSLNIFFAITLRKQFYQRQRKFPKWENYFLNQILPELCAQRQFPSRCWYAVLGMSIGLPTTMKVDKITRILLPLFCPLLLVHPHAIASAAYQQRQGITRILLPLFCPLLLVRPHTIASAAYQQRQRNTGQAQCSFNAMLAEGLFLKPGLFEEYC